MMTSINISLLFLLQIFFSICHLGLAELEVKPEASKCPEGGCLFRLQSVNPRTAEITISFEADFRSFYLRYSQYDNASWCSHSRYADREKNTTLTIRHIATGFYQLKIKSDIWMNYYIETDIKEKEILPQDFLKNATFITRIENRHEYLRVVLKLKIDKLLLEKNECEFLKESKELLYFYKCEIPANITKGVITAVDVRCETSWNTHAHCEVEVKLDRIKVEEKEDELFVSWFILMIPLIIFIFFLYLIYAIYKRRQLHRSEYTRNQNLFCLECISINSLSSNQSTESNLPTEINIIPNKEKR